MFDSIFLLVKTMLVVIAVGIVLVVIVYTAYLTIPLVILTVVGIVSYYTMKASRGY